MGLKLAGWIAYDDAVITNPGNAALYLTDQRLPNTPRWSGNASVHQEFPLWREINGFVGVAASFVGDRLSTFQATAQRQVFPSYAKTDLRAGIDYRTWTVSAYVNNVADVRGVIGGGIGYLYPPAFIYIQPRTVGLSVQRGF